jgi:hypothetical protein
MKLKINPLFIAMLFTCITGCNKLTSTNQSNSCYNYEHIIITSNSPVTIGQTIQFGTQEVGGYRIYSWRGPDYYTNQYPTNSIPYAEPENEGWYYLDLYSANGSCQKIDSVYIQVKLQQGTPSCTIANDNMAYDNMGTDIYSSLKKQIDPTYGEKALEGSASTSYSDLAVYFHPHWINAEPEDGIYNTINTPLFDQTDNNYNEVFVTTTTNSIYWSCYPNQTVYISHVGSKLQVRFCDLTMSGSNGTSFTTHASGNLIEK